MHEITLNLHMHSTYSDGHATHAQIACAAARAGIDAIIVTDHNIWVNGLEGYHTHNNQRVLVLVGEEIHDPLRSPQKNHLLVFGANQELSLYAANPQTLLDRVKQSGGFAYIAHPFDDSMPFIGEDDLSWVDWQVDGYAGIELWNGMSEIKSVAPNFLSAIFYAFFPKYLPHGPLTRTINLWDQLLSTGKKVTVIGGSDAHALPMHLGPLHRTIFPYEFHFRCVNTHLLLPSPLTGDLSSDRRMVLESLRQGKSFVGYDLPASTRGFRFTAQGKDGTVTMGDDISLLSGVTFQVRLPQKTYCRLLLNGKEVKSWRDREICTHIANAPGIYRIEAYIDYLGKRRGWIFSNPIFVKG